MRPEFGFQDNWYGFTFRIFDLPSNKATSYASLHWLSCFLPNPSSLLRGYFSVGISSIRVKTREYVQLDILQAPKDLNDIRKGTVESCTAACAGSSSEPFPSPVLRTGTSVVRPAPSFLSTIHGLFITRCDVYLS